jgi:predicted PurR-regulated permease PerM
LFEPLERYDWMRRLMDEAPRPEEIVRDQPGMITKATGFVSSTFAVVAAAGVVLFLGIFIGFDPQLYRGGILRLTPPRNRERTDEVLSRLGHTLRWWLVAHFASMAVVGALTGIGLALIGIPLAFILGVIAGLMAFVPNIGPIMSVIPAIILAFAQGPRQALYVILVYVGVQLLESNLITPLFELKAVSLPPALTVSVQLLLGTLTGVLGIILASPLCASAMVLVQAFYIEDTLGERALEDGTDIPAPAVRS